MTRQRSRAPAVVVHDKRGVAEPRDNGVIALDGSGHVWVFVSGRGRARPGFRYRSKKPFDVSAFERVSEEELTYPQPWFLRDHGGWVHLFTKYAKGRELYRETSPDGRVWSEDQLLAGFGGHYQVSSARGGRVATFFNMHPGGDVDRRTNLYHAQTDDRGGRWTTADGRRLGIPLRTVENPALVVDHAARGELIYTCDLNFDREGRPVLLHVVSRGADPGPENGPRRLCLTRWDGSAWRSHVITETDHNYDMGSVWVEGDAWKVIFPNAPGPHEFGCGGEMCLWESTDSGEHWRLARRITRSSHLEHNYARRPLFARDPFSAFWADGDPTRFSESRLYFRDSRGERVWRLPTKMTEETALPELADLEP